MITNVFGDPLERISADAFFAALKSMSVETGRLDFKSHEVSHEQVARAAAALANAGGGIIAIGFHDPKETGSELKLSGGSLDISNNGLTAWYAAIHARVNPPMTFNARGYELPNKARFLIIRVTPNSYAPHEFIARDGKRAMPVRRGSGTDQLTLAEIEALFVRRGGSSPRSWLADRPPMFPIRPGLRSAKFFGSCFTPCVAPPTRRVLSKDDTLAFGQIITAVVGHKLSPPLQPVTLVEGDGYFDVNPKPPGSGGFNFGLPQRLIHIRADGEVTVRYDVVDEPENHYAEWLKTLLIGHLTTSDVFNYLRVGPRASVAVGLALGPGRSETTPHLPQQFEDRFDVDFSVQTFAEAYTPTVMLCLREDAGPPDERAVMKTLNDTHTQYLGAADLRSFWM